MEKYVNRSTGVLLQPAQESVAAMLARCLLYTSRCV